MIAKLESTLLAALPGYAFVKTFGDNMRRSDEMAESFLPIAVYFDDYSQLAFEIEREPNGNVAVYLPSAPNPWSGTVVHIRPERVNRLSMTLNEALKNIRMLGKDSAGILEHQNLKIGSNQTTSELPYPLDGYPPSTDTFSIFTAPCGLREGNNSIGKP